MAPRLPVLALCLLMSIALACTLEEPVSAASQNVAMAAAESAEQDPPRPKPASSNRSILMSFLGDIMAHDVNFNRRPYGEIWDDLRGVLSEDDLSFGNMEFPVQPDREQQGYPRFSLQPEYPDAAIAAGIDLFCVANNHLLDQGLPGLRSTKAYLARAKEGRLGWSGLREYEDEGWRILTLRRAGFCIGFIAISQVINTAENLSHLYYLDYENQSPAAAAEREAFLACIAERAWAYDFLVVSVHAGGEYRTDPEESKKAFFSRLLDAGVDIVWGHHPHVLQPRVLSRGSRGDQLIIFSSGNCISGMGWNLDCRDPQPRAVLTSETALTQLRCGIDADGRRSIDVIELPLFNYRDEGSMMRILRAESLLSDPRLPAFKARHYAERAAFIREFLKPLAAAER